MTPPYFLDYLPLEGALALDFNNLNSPSPKDVLYQVWLKLAQWFLRRSRKCEKFTDGRTDGGQNAFGSGELIKPD